MLCPKCKAYNVDTDKFCAKCGTFLSPAGRPAAAPAPKVEVPPITPNQISCSKCGTANSGNDRFCLKCGTPLTAPVQPVPPPAPAAPRTGSNPCAKCSTLNADGDKFCLKCGNPLSSPVKPAAPLNIPPSSSEPSLLEASGINGNIELLQGKVKIKWNEKELALAQILSVEIKPADDSNNGMITIASTGQGDSQITFSKAQQKTFEAIKQAVEQAKIQAAKALANSAALADLEKLAELKAKGIITEEEFTAKKKQILGI
jgi:membrane protease subunit (stomatin/prohibitin family)